MKKLLLFFTLLATLCTGCNGETFEDFVTRKNNNWIRYTSHTNDILEFYTEDTVFGVGVLSHTYNDGKGIILFDGEIKIIPNSNFTGNIWLKSVIMPNSVTVIDECAFSGCCGLTSVTIPGSVTTIGDNAFKNCSDLASVTIPAGVTKIGDGVFENCSSLNSVTIPAGVTKIGTYAFYYCSSLTSVTIPAKVTSIGDYAFYNCSSLTSVYCKAKNPPVGGDDMFPWSFYGDFKIYVPMASVEAYKSADGWNVYANYIVGYNF